MNRTCCLLTLALIIAWALPAADPARIAAALASPVTSAQHPQAGAVVLLEETVLTLDGNGRCTVEGHLLVRILQERALGGLCDQRIPFRGDRQSCTILAARTHLPSGQSLEPEAGAIMDVAAPEAAAASPYSSARLKVVAFPGVVPGAAIELKFRINPLPGAADDGQPFMGEGLLAGTEPSRETTLTLRVPAGTGLRYELFNGCPAPVIRRAGATVGYTWTTRDQEQIVVEPGMVALEELVPRVVWSTAKDTGELGRWLARGFRKAAAPGPEVRSQALALTRGLASPEEQVDRIARFVTQEIRIIPLGLGQVGYLPGQASRILANRYADPQDKVALFMALLAALKLEAEPVFVRVTRARPAQLASLKEYQDLLARVQLPSGERFYHLGQDLARLGRLLPSHAGRPAMLVSRKGGRALRTPAVDRLQQCLRASWELELDAQGSLAGRLKLNLDGLFDKALRTWLAGRNAEERQGLFQGVLDGLRKGMQLENIQVSDGLDLERPVQVTLAFRCPRFACRQGDLLIVNLPDPFALGMAPILPLPQVRQPFQVTADCRLEAALVLRLPKGFRVLYRPPSSADRQGPFATGQTCATTADTLTLERRISWREEVVQPEAYPGLFQVFTRSQGPGNSLLLLEAATAASRQSAP
jgi:hypothetical protein